MRRRTATSHGRTAGAATRGLTPGIRQETYEEGERIAGIRNWENTAAAPAETRVADFEIWREEPSAFQSVAATRWGQWNVYSDDERAEPFAGVAMSASVGAILAAPVLQNLAQNQLVRSQSTLLVVLGVVLGTLLVEMLACVAPTLRGLRIQPIEALKEQ